MYLLKHDRTHSNSEIIKFTFHHVSIKTKYYFQHSSKFPDLHSTMYLLKLRFISSNELINRFTFHHVSIKTKSYAEKMVPRLIFTFHHVSIKTEIGCFFT